MSRPLADRVRPQTIEEIVGQQHLLGKNSLLRRFIEKGTDANMVFYGPSGTGKTTYACRSTEKLAANEPVPTDWCYVYNFQNPKKPIALYFEAGTGNH